MIFLGIVSQIFFEVAFAMLMEKEKDHPDVQNDLEKVKSAIRGGMLVVFMVSAAIQYYFWKVSDRYVAWKMPK